MTSKLLHTPAALLILLVAFTVGISGCGGGGDDETDQPDSLTKAEYVTQADQICAKTEKRQRKLLGKFQKENKNPEGGQKETEKMISFAALPPMEEQIEELSELPPPEKEAAKAKAYVTELEKGLKVAEKEPGTLLLNPGAFTKSEEAANAFGFKTCSGA